MADTLPEWLEPMAATLTEDRFTGPEWLFERKYDGIRLLAFKEGNDVRLITRYRKPQDIPELVNAIKRLPVRNIILDGELSWDRASTYHVFDILGWMASTSPACRSTHVARSWRTCR